ncbi:MAG: alpha/beta hydrolase [Microthrixaceae bacterium]
MGPFESGADSVGIPSPPADVRRPDRRYPVDSSGVEISVTEWGSESDPPLLLAHGGFDFAETLNRFAPMLADGGYRVVSWDQRGHGDSAWAHLYSWDADVRDAATVLSTIGGGAIPFVGHSKGGSLVMSLAEVAPHRVSSLVNLDGLPSGNNMPDVSEHERTRLQGEEMRAWLAHRRSLVERQRRPGTLEELAERRGRMNPRMTTEWLQYLVTVGARRDPDGWRWKLDPTMRFGGSGPWRPEWSMLRLPGLGKPMLGVVGKEPEVMGWGTTEADVIPYLPRGARVVGLDGVGHFVHIEAPRLVADMILEFLA